MEAGLTAAARQAADTLGFIAFLAACVLLATGGGL
jgi:hypothetical protein